MFDERIPLSPGVIEEDDDDWDGTYIELPHAGEILYDEFMVPLGLTGNALAKAIGVVPSQINRIVKGHMGISAEMSLRLGRYFGMNASFFHDLQKDYEIRMAKRALGDRLLEIQPRPMAA